VSMIKPLNARTDRLLLFGDVHSSSLEDTSVSRSNSNTHRRSIDVACLVVLGGRVHEDFSVEILNFPHSSSLVCENRFPSNLFNASLPKKFHYLYPIVQLILARNPYACEDYIKKLGGGGEFSSDAMIDFHMVRAYCSACMLDFNGVRA